uniref:Uncharacterized protein n=1 Tax=Vombatus ursinus TaxID=29139 RepID=A0A4X2KWA0_VOMUR
STALVCLPDNQQFLANINCSVLLLPCLSHDLCSFAGTLKLLFQVKLPGESASKFLQDRNVYYICKVQRGPRGTRSENAYRAIVPLLKEPEQDLLDTLKAQCDALEKSRIQKLRDQAAKKIVPKKVHIIEPVRLVVPDYPQAYQHSQPLPRDLPPDWPPRLLLLSKLDPP